MTAPDGPTSPWSDAVLAAALLAIAPTGLGGLQLRALPGPVRDAWFDVLRDLLPEGTPLRRIPAHVTTSALLGGIDLAATLKAGRPVAQRGLLVGCDGGIALLAMAERASRATAAQLARALDFAEVAVERDGIAARHRSAFAVVALDEAIDDDESVSPAIADRVALHVDLHDVGIGDLAVDVPGLGDVLAAREGLADVDYGDDDVMQLCAVAAALGVGSPRADLFALRAARANAALRGGRTVAAGDLAVAARLVLAPRATVLPNVEAEPADDPVPPPPEQTEQPPQDENATAGEPVEADKLEDQVLAAALAAIPAGLLAGLKTGRGPRQRAQTTGKSGALQASKLRGRPMGARRGDPRSGARLSLIDTLRAAAPWQAVRRRQRAEAGAGHRVLVERDDFRVIRFKQRAETTTIFVVDASGSAALHRLAEAKGAVEILLADCYVRRDQVALIAFRGDIAEMLLPPTRSLVRTKRCLAALPGGGGTPLAAGLDAAAALVDLVLRRGGTPTVVCLTDGRANVARDGTRGRERALADALESATALRLTGVRSIVIDTSPRPHASAERLADALQGIYMPLPHADASRLSDVVQQASRTTAAAGR